MIQEQSARKAAEKQAHQLEFLAEAGMALSESLDLAQVLNRFCAAVVRSFSDGCVVDLLSEDGTEFEHLIMDHADPRYIPLIREFRDDFPVDWSQKQGLAEVIRSGQAELIRSFSNDAEELARFRTSGYAARIRELNIHSLMLVPIILYGRSVGVVTFLSNSPERKFDDVDLAMAFDLARRVSMAIENSKLYSGAESANRAKSAFLANMSHEIRTPLGAMLGFAEMIEEGELSGEQRMAVSTILRNGRQLLRIVDEILDLSKVESERIRIERVNFDLRQLIDEVFSLLDRQAREKKLWFSVVLDPEIPRFACSDPTRIRQILINVIGNAIKFTREGSVKVEVRRLPSPADRFSLDVSIIDTGIGVSPEQASKLFQPFAQADESTTRRFGGTGLGLFLSRKLARLLGGDLTLESSAPGRGSHFLLTLEMERSKNPVGEEKIPAEIAKKDPKSGKTKILIVDDAPDNRVLISHFIGKSGYELETAENGAQGVEKALNGFFDVVLMDIQMPEMDGFEAVRRLRQAHFEKPIIALTAHAMKGDREACLQQGFSDYLSKPIDQSQLLEMLQKHLSIP